MTATTTHPNSNIEVTLFDPPSGTVRGSVTASLPTKKGSKVIAQTLLLTDKPAKISLKLPATVTPDECAEAVAILGEYAAKVRELDVRT
jgi:hypothetical protein